MSKLLDYSNNSRGSYSIHEEYLGQTWNSRSRDLRQWFTVKCRSLLAYFQFAKEYQFKLVTSSRGVARILGRRGGGANVKRLHVLAQTNKIFFGPETTAIN